MSLRWFVGPAALAALGALVLYSLPARAGSCGVVAPVVKTTSYAPTVVTKTVVAVPTFIPVAVYPVAVPLYTATYQPGVVTPTVGAAPATSAPTAQPSADTQAILKALQAIDGRLRLLEKAGPPPAMPGVSAPGSAPTVSAPAQAQAPAGFPPVLTAKCAQCHTRGKEKGSFVMFEANGVPVKLTDAAQLGITRAVYRQQMLPRNSGIPPLTDYRQQMPPRNSGIPPLTDQEVGDIVAWMVATK